MTAELVRTQVDNPHDQIQYGANVARHLKDAFDARANWEYRKTLERPAWKSVWDYQEILARMEQRFATASVRGDFLVELGLELDAIDTETTESRAHGILKAVDYETRALFLENEGEPLEPLTVAEGRFTTGGDGIAHYRGENLLLTLKVLSYGQGQDWAVRS